MTTTPRRRKPPRPQLTGDQWEAELKARHAARWDIWVVYGHPRSWWCVKPAGTTIGIHNEDSPEALDAWLHRVDVLTDSGFAITWLSAFHDTATVTWTSPGSQPATFGPATVPDVLDYAEDINARRIGLIEWLTKDPEGTARHMSDAQVEGFLPFIADDNAHRVLEAMLRENAGRRREYYLDRSLSLPPTGPLALLLDDAETAEAESE